MRYDDCTCVFYDNVESMAPSMTPPPEYHVWVERADLTVRDSAGVQFNELGWKIQ